MGKIRDLLIEENKRNLEVKRKEIKASEKRLKIYQADLEVEKKIISEGKKGLAKERSTTERNYLGPMKIAKTNIATLENLLSVEKGNLAKILKEEDHLNVKQYFLKNKEWQF